MPDPHHLQRFVEAQDTVYEHVLDELHQGQKRSHWMWFIFPQIQGLGRTETARHYAIASLDEARAYLAHPILGLRLAECTGLLLQIQGRTINEILGSPDDMKLRSSLTLFAAATADNRIYFDALDKFYGGEPDPLTTAKVGAPQRR